jgi:hypothetical protein|tara:strand:- start:1019 stop:1243 length:225 start_codon:yes stop_codon:yes gene_type:complete
MKVSQVIKQNVVDTSAFRNLPPLHKDVVTDFYNNLNYDNDDVVKEVETTIDNVSLQHNIKTDVIYDYIDNELGE